MAEIHEVFVCRRSRENPKPCCADNLSEEEFLRMKQELETKYSVVLTPRGCQGLCPYEGFAIRQDTRPELVSSMGDLAEKIEAYKKDKASEYNNGYSNR